jgi:hypothetical protein
VVCSRAAQWAMSLTGCVPSLQYFAEQEEQKLPARGIIGWQHVSHTLHGATPENLKVMWRRLIGQRWYLTYARITVELLCGFSGWTMCWALGWA